MENQGPQTFGKIELKKRNNPRIPITVNTERKTVNVMESAQITFTRDQMRAIYALTDISEVATMQAEERERTLLNKGENCRHILRVIAKRALLDLDDVMDSDQLMKAFR